jgi:hypothetical protein
MIPLCMQKSGLKVLSYACGGMGKVRGKEVEQPFDRECFKLRQKRCRSHIAQVLSRGIYIQDIGTRKQMWPT